MIQGLIDLKADFNKKEMLNWLLEVEEILEVPKGSKNWVGKVNFGFRLDEIASTRRKLRD